MECSFFRFYGHIFMSFLSGLILWFIVGVARLLQLLLSGKYLLWKSSSSTGLGSVSEVGRFTGAYEIVCIKHAGRIVDYMQWAIWPIANLPLREVPKRSAGDGCSLKLIKAHSTLKLRIATPSEQCLRPVVFGVLFDTKKYRAIYHWKFFHPVRFMTVL